MKTKFTEIFMRHVAHETIPSILPTQTHRTVCVVYRYTSKSFMNTNEATFGLLKEKKMEEMIDQKTDQHKTAFLDFLVWVFTGKFFTICALVVT